MDLKHNLLRLAKNSVVYGGSDVLVRFINFLLLPLFTTYLTPEEYGISSILGVVLFLVTSLFSFGLSAATGPCYFESADSSKRGAVIWTSFAILLCGAVLVTGAGWLWSARISMAAFGSAGHSELVFLTVVTAALSLLVDPLNLHLRFEERAKMVGVLSILSAVVTAAATVGLVVFARRGILGLVEGGLIGRVGTLVLFLIPTIVSLRFRVRAAIAWQLLRLGLPLVPTFAFVFLLQHAGKFILQWFRGLDEVGVYQVGVNLGMIISVGVGAFQSAWYPFFMSFMTRQDEAKHLFGRVLTYYVLSVGGGAVLLFIWGRPLVMLMTQPDFAGAHWVVGWSALAQCFNGIFLILLPGLYYAKEVRCVTLVQSGAAAVAIGLDFLLIPFFGLKGAALALALGYLAMAGLLWGWNCWRRREYVTVVYESNRLVWLTAMSVPFVALSCWDRHFSLSHELILSVFMSLLLLGFLYSRLDREERRVIAKTISRCVPSIPRQV